MKEVIDFMIRDDGKAKPVGHKRGRFTDSYFYNIDFLAIRFQFYFQVKFKHAVFPDPIFFSRKLNMSCFLYSDRTTSHGLDEHGNPMLYFKGADWRSGNGTSAWRASRLRNGGRV